MINVLMCVHKSGDVLQVTLKPLLGCNAITKILIADGPHLNAIKPGIFVDNPSVKDVVTAINSNKIFYEYTDNMPTRSEKNNSVLQHTDDCEWILNVDSDEVHHEKGLKRLVKFLSNAEGDKFRIKTIDPYPDFFHEIRIPDWKPRVYRYKKGYICPPQVDRAHQYVALPGGQYYTGFRDIPENVCRIYHLNALRDKFPKRLKKIDNDVFEWSGGKLKFHSKIHEIDRKLIPKCILELGKTKLFK